QEDSETAASRHQHDSPRAILLLHGLNERSWNKYYPWAHRLASLTGRPVILFPTAFHIDRSPSEWQDIREMTPQVKARRMLAKILKKSVMGLSFANVALSSRIEEAPERFIRAGFQTMLDIEKFAAQARAGKLPQIPKNSSFDFFCYSIGCSLGQSLLMSDLSKPAKKRLFVDSRQVFFCGSALLEYANPISKLILDEESYRVLNAYFYALAHDDASALKRVKGRKLKKFDRLQSMAAILYGDAKKSYREEKLKIIGKRSLVISMEGDSVFPPEAIRRTWSLRNNEASKDQDGSKDQDVSMGQEVSMGHWGSMRQEASIDQDVPMEHEAKMGYENSAAAYLKKEDKIQDKIQEEHNTIPLTEIKTYSPPTASSHENPFPRERSPEKRSLVDNAFDALFTNIASWYVSRKNDSE
ncbi:MAG: DUF6051 family protein, partial [Spirochaetia bacterium]|nr:DUF6051 family protein [Spirochaetia bacterium]